MSRDYGQKRPMRNKGNGSYQCLALVMTFLFGYVSATVFDPEKLSHWFNHQVLAEHHVKTQLAKAANQDELPPKPKFEFYTLLENETGPATAAHTAQNQELVSDKITSMATSAAAAAKALVAVTQNKSQVFAKAPAPKVPVYTAPTRGGYAVQVAAFKARRDAEQLRGKLVLKGFEVNVVSISQASGTWFRVVVGPYASRQSAQQAQINLARNYRLNGMLTSAGA